MASAITLFDRFGGIRPMADALSEPPSTVQSWKSAGRIPATKQAQVLERAEQLGLEVTATDLIFPLGRHPHPHPAEPSASPTDDTLPS